MKIDFKIKRFIPEKTEQASYSIYSVTVDPNDRILDVLLYIKNFIDGSLSFRKSCAHGICGSDAMLINGMERLACKTLVKDACSNEEDVILIEPLKHFPVKRDLIVDQYSFFEKYRSVKPYLINDSPVKEKERLQSPEELNIFRDTTNCILCSACYSACPVIGQADFLGPAAIAQAYRFNADTRDMGFEERLNVLDSDVGVWPCENHFECTRCCPRGIKITKRINQTKKAITEHKKLRG